MLHASTQKLIIKLCELTEAGHIPWKHGEGRTCRFDTEGYVVEVQSQPARLRLLHADGRELERAEEADLAGEPWPGGDGTFAAQITLLAARADRIARGAEFAISRILTSLSAPPKSAPFAFPASASAAPVKQDEPAPPPAPHTVPGPPPEAIASDTAIDRVLAVKPEPPRTIEPPAPEPSAPEPSAEAEPAVIESRATTHAPAPVEQPARSSVVPPASEPAVAPTIPRRQDMFGATKSFARPTDLSEAPAAEEAPPPKPFSTSPLFFGVNQMSREPARAEPDPPPVPAPTAKPIPPPPPVAEKKPEPVIAGPDIYKPWS